MMKDEKKNTDCSEGSVTSDLPQNNPLEAEFRLYRVDLQQNLFSLLSSNELENAKGVPQVDSTFFLPGCMFQAVAPELVEIVYNWLRLRGVVDAFSSQCCGSILQYSAPKNEKVQQEYGEAQIGRLQKYGACRIITSCPNCYYVYRSLVEASEEHIEVLPLSHVLREQGLTIATRVVEGALDVQTTYSIHDSCPDRRLGVFAQSTRALFDETSLREMKHHHESSQCCGFGRLLGVRNPAAAERINTHRINEFFSTDADMLVTACFTCASAMSSLAPAGKTAHYLELLFDHRIDWAKANERMQRAQEACQESI